VARIIKECVTHYDAQGLVCPWELGINDPAVLLQRYPKYEGWKFNSGNYLFTTDTK